MPSQFFTPNTGGPGQQPLGKDVFRFKGNAGGNDLLVDANSAFFTGGSGNVQANRKRLEGVSDLFSNDAFANQYFGFPGGTSDSEANRLNIAREQFLSRLEAPQLWDLQKFAQGLTSENITQQGFALENTTDAARQNFGELFNEGNQDILNQFFQGQDLGFLNSQIGVQPGSGQFGFAGDQPLSADQLDQFFGQGGDFLAFQFASDQGMVDESGNVLVEQVGVDAEGNFFKKETPDLQPHEVDDFIARLDFNPLVDGLQALDELYDDDTMANFEFNQFMSSNIDPNNPDRGTFGDLFPNIMTVDALGRPTFTEGIDEALAQELVSRFGHWKADRDTKFAEDAADLTAKTDAATATGVPAEDLIKGEDGLYVPDPAKYQQEDDGTYSLVIPDDTGGDGGGGDDAGTDPAPLGVPDVGGTLKSFAEEVFGEDAAKSLFNALFGGLETDEQTRERFETLFAPNETRFKEDEVPGVKATAVEASGGFAGGSLHDATTKAEARFLEIKESQFIKFHDAQEARELAIVDRAFALSKDIGDYSQTLANIGQTLATTDLIKTQAAVAESGQWAQLGLIDANIQFINKQMEVMDSDILWNTYQLAVAEGGFDANVLASAQQYYMNNYLGALGDPLISLIMAFADIQTQAGVLNSTGSGAGGFLSGLGDLLPALLNSGTQKTGTPDAGSGSGTLFGGAGSRS